jgi:hypothetical protein
VTRSGFRFARSSHVGHKFGEQREVVLDHPGSRFDLRHSKTLENTSNASAPALLSAQRLNWIDALGPAGRLPGRQGGEGEQRHRGCGKRHRVQRFDAL